MSEPITPVSTAQFGLAAHKTSQHFCTVKSSLCTPEYLENPITWSHVKARLRTFDEIRVVSEDGNFVACLLVTSADTGLAYVRTVWAKQLEAVEEQTTVQSRYIIKMRGQLKWCVVDTTDDRNVRTGIGTQSEAMRELEEYVRVLQR